MNGGREEGEKVREGEREKKEHQERGMGVKVECVRKGGREKRGDKKG